MPFTPKTYHGISALRRGRFSLHGADYFLTCCLERPLSGLTKLDIAPLVQEQIHAVAAQGIWTVRTSILMPDHLHLLVTLVAGSSLAKGVRLFKGPLTPLLRSHQLRWQENYYDHRIRSLDELRPTFLYIFLNPYQAGLVSPEQKWPWFECAPDDWEWFGGMTNEAHPFPEWLQ